MGLTLANRRWLGWLLGLSVFALLALGLILPPLTHPNPPYRPTRAKTDLANLQAAMEAHKTEYGDYPRGNATQIMSALGGENRLHFVFLNLPPKRVNAPGEFLDPWGTPYRITFDEAGKPHVYSFGPNHQDDQCRKGSDDITLDDPALVGRPNP